MVWNRTRCTFAARLINKQMMEFVEVPPINRPGVKKRYKEMFGSTLDEPIEGTPFSDDE